MIVVPDAWGATLTALIDPWDNEGVFSVSYLQSYSIQHDGQGSIARELDGQGWNIDRSFDTSDPGVDELTKRLNSGILAERSQVTISDMSVEYSTSMVTRERSADIDYKIVLSGNINDFIITNEDPVNPGIIDVGWRYFSIEEPVVIDGIDINTPAAALEANVPNVYEAIIDTDGGVLLSEPLMIGDGFSEPLTVWHFLFDPTGINVDAGQFGLSDRIADKAIAKYTLGESSIREGRKTDEIVNVPFTLDHTYQVRTIDTVDIAELAVIGYTSISSLDDLETLGFSKEPIGTTTSTGQFPVMIVYGMAGMAAVGAGLFFFISSRQLKKEKGATQTGIDPSLLQASATSEAAGGYRTNRGESQLRTDYESRARSSPELGESGSTHGTMPKGWKKG